MFTELQYLLQNTDIRTIQLYASDYELVLKQLLAIYCDRYQDSSVFYWNSGYENLVELELFAGRMDTAKSQTTSQTQTN